MSIKHFPSLFLLFVILSHVLEAQTDTISITKKVMAWDKTIKKVNELMLVREKQGDSLLRFQYFKRDSLYEQYDFNIQEGHFSLVKVVGNQELKVMDTFEISLLGDKELLFKDEAKNPPNHGNGGFLFSKTYGLIGSTAYSWDFNGILTRWNDLDLEETLINLFLNKEAPYLIPTKE